MNADFAFWWQARSRRERGLLIVMAALAAFVLGWLLIVRPLSDARAAQETRHAAAAVALADARARAAVNRGTVVEVSPLPVDSLIGRTAGEAGFAAARIAAQGPGRATVAIDAARPQALFGWIARLEASGLVVERLRAQANADRTISAEAVLRKRRR